MNSVAVVPNADDDDHHEHDGDENRHGGGCDGAGGGTGDGADLAHRPTGWWILMT